MTEYDTLYDKIKHAKAVTRKTLEEYDNPVVGFTGGKDSTLVLWLVKEVCREERFDKPDVMFIDHGQHFDVMVEYVNKITEEWGFDLRVAENEFLTQFEPEETLDFVDLPMEQQDELREKFENIDSEEYREDGRTVVENSLNTKFGNHLLKTYAMNQFIKENDVDAVINGIRWDEHDSRSDEDFFSERENPEHTRVHPILHITERDVWDITWFRIVPQETEGEWVKGYPSEGFTRGLESEMTPQRSPSHLIPVAPKYFEGFRSIGSETQTEKTDDKAAWNQDLTVGTERQGRAQDKDEGDAMSELRQKGYM